MTNKFYALVMAGGQGTRFWPESTSKKPKQYLNLTSEKSLLEETLLRFNGLIEAPDRFVVTVKDQQQLAEKCSKALTHVNGLIYEPAGKNTGPCILLAMAHLLQCGAKLNDVVTIVPSDHVILNANGFREVMSDARNLAEKTKSIVTIGVVPTFPHTGFGYIQKGSDFKVLAFREKPDFETAKKYVASGEYFWNAGMFVAQISVLLDEFSKHSPESFKFFESLQKELKNPAVLKEAYEQMPSNSIDYAVMEKSQKVLVVPSRFDWNDLGSWDALESVIKPMNQNTIVKARDVFASNATGNIIFAPDKFVALMNVDDLVVISNKDSVVVIPKKDAQKVKEVVAYLKGKDFGSDLI
jgi:mannose-1-phosphate guanylyltransferase